MEVKLSTEEVKAIAAEVVRQMSASGQSTKSGKTGTKSAAASEPVAEASATETDASQDAPSVYSIASAAEEVNQHPNTIRNAITSGKIKAKLVGRSYQIKQKDLQKYAGARSK